MKPSDILSIAAFILSLISVSFSIYLGLRDRPQLKTSCIYFSYEDSSKVPQLRIKAVNVGRRPISLYAFGATYANGNWQTKSFEITSSMHEENEWKVTEEHGKRLHEYEYFEETISPEHEFFSSPVREGADLISIWLEDTRGVRYEISRSRKYLQFLNQYKN